MAPPTSVPSSLLLLTAVAGCACGPCREGRTFANAVISPDLATTRIARGPPGTPAVDCTAACCELAGCDLAWWFEGRCYLVSCPRSESCEPKTVGSIGSFLTFVRRPARLLDRGAMLLNRGAPSGLWGDAPEEIRKDLPFLGQERGPEETPEYSDDYGEPERAPERPLGKPGPRGSAEHTAWGPRPGGQAGGSPSAGGGLPGAAEKQDRPALHPLNAPPWAAAPQQSPESGSLPSSVTVPPWGEALGKEAFQRQERPSAGSGREVLISSRHPPPARVAFSPASTEKSPLPTVPAWSPEHGALTPPTSLVPTEPTPPEQPASPTAASRTETTYSYEWSLISHPVNYRDEIKERHTQTLHVSHLSAGLYAFKVAVSGENAFGEGFVNVTVKPARRVNLPPTAVVSPQMQALTLPWTSAFLDGSQSTDDTKIVNYRWEEVSGPFREETPTDSPVLHLSNLVPGNYTFRLTVTDSDGASNSTTAALIVNSAVDHPPVANAGPNQTITLPQNSITLNGNQSSDDHQIVLYEWSLGPGSESKEVAMQGVETPYLHLSAMQEGDYMFQLMVTDSSKQRSTAVVTVTVQPESNRPPVAVAGPDKELVFPVESTTLDGSRSTDDQGIVLYHWEHVRGPGAVQMENPDDAVATVRRLRVGTHRFRLTVTDGQGLSSTTTLTVAVKKGNNSPPRAHAGGRHVLVLPNNCVTLDGSRSTDDQGVVSYLWVRDGQSPAAGDVIEGSDRSAALQLTNLVEGVYTFRLQVADGQGASDTDTATVEVRPDPRKSGLVELTLQVGVGRLTEQQKDTLMRHLAALLNVPDSDVKVQKIQAHSDLSTVIVFYVQSGPPFEVLKAADVVHSLHRQLSKEKADSLLFKVLRIDTAGCLLQCSGHGHCDPVTKRCVCSRLWMENLIQRYIRDGESNCEWSIFYVTALALTVLVLIGGSPWLCIYCCKRRKRTKIRKKTKYTILDNMDDQERMELRPKYGIKHRSTEHNSSLMVSESEFDSDQDTIFSRERMERGNPKVAMNGSLRNGASFSYCAKDR
ncbi:dyslexia-associated protein KIAA0319 homolog isoform X2 [Neomonachus schauinslandi]|uniref:Dyslexia-associated protein KIAA0319 homolog isoform X2 n=1 Tax=Neomonachus schauinslandi TaxID=29088 RepID=A0A8M1MR42_NEOSC|nr:dyslexia-associated protein KIAA0319 homolog isoform X2 [Neomonachus schauinslandi]